MLRRTTRWFTLAGFVLAGLCFVLPFVAVSCDVPGGYGAAEPGASTTYTGLDLAVGGEPDVRPSDKVAPPEQRRDDRVGPMPLAIVALLLTIGGAVAAVLHKRGVRRASAALIALAAAVCLVLNQAMAKQLLADRIRDQLTAPLPAGKAPADYVHTDGGFLICLLLLVVTVLGNAAAWSVGRRRRADTAGQTRTAA